MLEKNLDKQLNIIKRGTVEIIQQDELEKKLKKSIQNNKPLIIKAGFDPSAPDLHLGHTVLLRKMRHFQELGHTVVFLIGDFTGRIGDPTGQSQIRKHLTKREVIINAKTYKKQIFKILDPKKTVVKFNSKWCERMSVEDFLKLSSNYTVARILERDDFQNRYKQNKPISMLEFIYPLIQGYDSVVLKADIELGGTDQKFNLLVGRELQKSYNQESQIVITMPILEGLDGVQKMSKSLNNYIGINEEPKNIYGKVMSVSDALMWKYYELLTDENVNNIKNDVEKDILHPKAAKERLAYIVTSFYWGEKSAKQAKEEFEKVFSQRQLPEKIQTITFPYKEIEIVKLLVSSNLCPSNSEARRLITQGAVKIDGEKCTKVDIILKLDTEKIVQVGKRQFAKIISKQQ